MRRLLIVLGLLLATPAAAQQRMVAVVEDISVEVGGLDIMMILSEGREIRLPAGARLIVGYFASCMREIIVGGVVRIGVAQSSVSGGQVNRERVECDGGNLRLEPRQIAALPDDGLPRGRGSRGPGDHAPPVPVTPRSDVPELTIYGRSPAIEVGTPLVITIERLDGSNWMTLALSSRDLQNGVYDMARAGVVLEPGGIYRISAGGRQIVIRVAPDARTGTVPLLQRLVRL